MKPVLKINYHQRFARVVDFIDKHLSQDIDIQILSEVALFSKFHFHRQFSGYLGMTVSRYIQLMRLKRASYQLAFRLEIRVTDIGLDAGFENAESFSRAFKAAFAQTPSEFRHQPDWQLWRQHYRPIEDHRERLMSIQNYSVEIVEFPETKVVMMMHRGSPGRMVNTLRQFIDWRKKEKLSPPESKTFNLLFDDPRATSAEDFRFGICASIRRSIPDNDYGVINETIPAGRCAMIRHIGSDSLIGKVVEHLYSSWLLQSEEALRDFPCFFHRVSFFPDVPEHEMITDVYLPIEKTDYYRKR